MFDETISKFLPEEMNKSPRSEDDVYYSQFGSPPRNTSVFTQGLGADKID